MYGISYIPSYKTKSCCFDKTSCNSCYFYSIFSNITCLFGVHNLCDNFHGKRNTNSTIYLSNFSFSKASANAVLKSNNLQFIYIHFLIIVSTGKKISVRIKVEYLQEDCVEHPYPTNKFVLWSI